MKSSVPSWGTISLIICSHSCSPGLAPGESQVLIINKIFIVTMLISGGLAGLAGTGELFGVQYRLRPDLSPGYGYTGIIVAMLAGLNPIGVLPAGSLVAALVTGAAQMRI